MHRMTNFFALEEAPHDLRHFAVQQRFAAGDGNHGRAALVDRAHAFVVAEALVQDLVGIVDLAAARAGEVAAEQRLEHQHERIAPRPAQMLLHHIGADCAQPVSAEFPRHCSTFADCRLRFLSSAGRRNSIFSSDAVHLA